MYTLHIANKNYSSWSLRPWALLRALAIPFEEALHRFPEHPAEGPSPFLAFSPTGRVPCLHDDATIVWDSLAIVEYLAERHAGVWPIDPAARAWARCACAEMHAGFATLRAQASMSVGVRIRLHEITPALTRDVARIDELWQQGLERFGGPFLAGGEFAAVDAFFAPVAFRLQTYGLQPGQQAHDYAARLLAHPVLQEWAQAALAEDFRDAGHEAEILASGELLADLRAAPACA